MQLHIMNAPIRTAVLGGRLKCSPTLTPFVCSSFLPLSRPQQRPLSTTSTSTSLRQPTRRHPLSPNDRRRNAVKSSTSSSSLLNRPSTSPYSTTTAPNSTPSSASTSASPPPNDPLNWTQFFILRASRRRYTLTASLLTSLGTTAAGILVLTNVDIEVLGVQSIGLDPYILLGIATFACGAVGWLAGPFVGNAVWRLFHRSKVAGMNLKEKEFYTRIKRYRADPSSSSAANPVPDYYGERIGSVGGYRQWLKDQRAFNRKRKSFV